MCVRGRVKSILKYSLVILLLFTMTACNVNTRKNSYEGGVSLSYSPNDYEIQSNRYTHFYDNRADLPTYGTKGYECIAENQNLALWLDKDENRIRIEDKSTGYVWGSLANDEAIGLNSNWTSFAGNIAGIEYYDEKLNEKRSGVSSSTASVKYTMAKDGFTTNVSLDMLDIAFDIIISLEITGIKVVVPNDSILESGDNLLKSIHILPFLGSSLEDAIDGYMLIPDGPGALVQFNKKQQYSNNYDKKVYGYDYGFDRLTQATDLMTSRPNDFAVSDNDVTLPVFGLVHGRDQNAFIASIGMGAEYASIVATPAGFLTDYNWVCARFNYRQKYNQPTSKTGGGVIVANKQRNTFNLEISYDFLSGSDASYAGMAVFYRNKMEKNNLLPSNNLTKSHLPLRIEMLGADIEKLLLYSRIKVFTSAEEAGYILEDLISKDIENITAVFRGFYKGGISSSPIGKIEHEGKVGSIDDFQSLHDLLADKGRLYYYVNPVTGTERQVHFKNNVGISISKDYISRSSSNSSIVYSDTYFIKSTMIPGYITKYISADIYPQDLFALDDLGSYLYSDYTGSSITSRDQALELLEKSMEQATSTTDGLALYNPNQYMLRYADNLFDIPRVSSQYLFMSDTVPFLQIVLSGSVDTYSEFLNLGINSIYTLLKLVEYNINPSFLVTYTDSSELINTPQEKHYSTCYEDWKIQIGECYDFINGALRGVRGQKIIDHKALSQGVIRVEYEQGTGIYINYNNFKVTVDDMVIEPLSYYVKEGGT